MNPRIPTIRNTIPTAIAAFCVIVRVVPSRVCCCPLTVVDLMGPPVVLIVNCRCHSSLPTDAGLAVTWNLWPSLRISRDELEERAVLAARFVLLVDEREFLAIELL